MKIILALLIFSAIILFHELGHFLLAKKNKIVVTEFSLGMGPRLLSTEKNGTRYSLKLLPLGGSCAMLGEDMEDESKGTFNGAPVWGRIATVAAGPVFNFILAFVFAVLIVRWWAMTRQRLRRWRVVLLWLKLVFRKGILSKNIRGIILIWQEIFICICI